MFSYIFLIHKTILITAILKYLCDISTQRVLFSLGECLQAQFSSASVCEKAFIAECRALTGESSFGFLSINSPFRLWIPDKLIVGRLLYCLLRNPQKQQSSVHHSDGELHSKQRFRPFRSTYK